MAEPSLDDVLSGAPVESEEVKAESQETVEPKGEQVTKAEVEEPKAEVETKDEPPSSDNKIDPDQFKGYLDEREKRQKLEAELIEMRKQIEAKAEPAKEVDPLVDPEGFKQQMRHEMNVELFEMKRELMASQHDDWPQAEAWINEKIGESAVIRAQLEGSKNVLADSYKLYKDHLALEELKDVDGLKARLREEVRAEMEAEKTGKTEAEEKAATIVKQATEKPSLASVATSKGASTTGELSLEDLVGNDATSRPR